MSKDIDTGPAAARANASAPGVIGRYRIVSEKGTGTFGTVYLAEDSTTGRHVAVRLLPRAVTETPTVAEMLRRSAPAVIEASRAHPALLPVLEYGTTDDGQLFAVMERAEGRCLKDTVAERATTDLAATLQLAIDLGGPAETLHNMGFVHGALRPANFVLTGDGKVKLLDVELVALRHLPALRQLVSEHSPAAYLAPEQIQGRAVTVKTDVYSFAVLLYHLLSGTPPFDAASRQEVLDKHLNEAPPPLRRRRRSVPTPVEAALLEALDKRPDHRPFMQKLLNLIFAIETTAATGRWKRVSAITAGFIVVVALGAPVAWRLFAPRTTAPVQAGAPANRQPVPNAQPAPPPTTPAPSETSPPAPAPVAIAPPASPPPATKPEVTTPPRAVPAPRAVAPAAPRPEGERPRPDPAPAIVGSTSMRSAPSRPAAAEVEEPDPAAVIDWLLNKRN